MINYDQVAKSQMGDLIPFESRPKPLLYITSKPPVLVLEDSKLDMSIMKPEFLEMLYSKIDFSDVEVILTDGNKNNFSLVRRIAKACQDNPDIFQINMRGSDLVRDLEGICNPYVPYSINDPILLNLLRQKTSNQDANEQLKKANYI